MKMIIEFNLDKEADKKNFEDYKNLSKYKEIIKRIENYINTNDFGKLINDHYKMNDYGVEGKGEEYAYDGERPYTNDELYAIQYHYEGVLDDLSDILSILRV